MPANKIVYCFLLQDVIKSGVIALFFFCGAIPLAVYGDEWADMRQIYDGTPVESLISRVTVSVQTAAVSYNDTILIHKTRRLHYMCTILPHLSS